MNTRKVEPPAAAPSTRYRLMSAGLDLTNWPDPKLASVEFTAKALQAGERVFVPLAMEPLVATLLGKQHESAR